jgi:hypothetical protein
VFVSFYHISYFFSILNISILMKVNKSSYNLSKYAEYVTIFLDFRKE